MYQHPRRHYQNTSIEGKYQPCPTRTVLQLRLPNLSTASQTKVKSLVCTLMEFTNLALTDVLQMPSSWQGMYTTCTKDPFTENVFSEVRWLSSLVDA